MLGRLSLKGLVLMGRACRGSYDISQKKPLAGSSFSGASKGNATVKVDSSDYYVMVIANTANSGSADVLYQFATYSANSSGEHIPSQSETALLLPAPLLPPRHTVHSAQHHQANPDI